MNGTRRIVIFRPSGQIECHIGITMNIYVKSLVASQVDAMDLLGEEFEKQILPSNNGKSLINYLFDEMRPLRGKYR
jgi:hypothetical protein